MTRNNKGRSGGDRPTPKTTDTPNHTGADPLAGWFSLADFAKASRAKRKQKRGWQKGGAR